MQKFFWAQGARVLLQWRKRELHRCKTGFRWCKRLLADFCSLGPKHLLHPLLTTLAAFKGPGHNQDFSRKKVHVGNPPVWKPPGLASLIAISPTSSVPESVPRISLKNSGVRGAKVSRRQPVGHSLEHPVFVGTCSRTLSGTLRARETPLVQLVGEIPVLRCCFAPPSVRNLQGYF